jgi:hypothetical protein
MWLRALIIARGHLLSKRKGHGVLFNPARDSIFFWKVFPHTGTTMPIPRYVNEVISDVRGIKPGWYAMDDIGYLSTGPFPTKAECLGSITQPTFEPLGSPPK